MRDAMSTPPPFQFAFDATSTMPDALPYVARLQWNATLNRIEHQLFPLQQEPLSATHTRVFGHFRASPMDIIETRRGAITRKRKRLDLISWFLVVPHGCLVLIGEGHDTTAAERIRKFLSGTLSVNQLGHQRWDFNTAVSDWTAIPSRPLTESPQPRVGFLEDRRKMLLRELREIESELSQLKGSHSHT